MIHRVVPSFLGPALVLLLVVGCKSPQEPPSSYSVGGTVLLDGRPLADGEVHFILTGQPKAIFPVKDGAFTGQGKAGSYRVEVYAYRGRKDQAGQSGQKATPPPQNYIPARFNSQSRLTADVGPAGQSQFEFKVASK